MQTLTRKRFCDIIIPDETGSYQFEQKTGNRKEEPAKWCLIFHSGMTVRGRLVKHYYGMDMPHILYSVKREELLPQRQ